MKNQYITFIEGNKESLEEAIKLAKENGYRQWDFSTSKNMKGHGILACGDDGDYLTSLLSEEELKEEGYTELKRPSIEKEDLPITHFLEKAINACSNTQMVGDTINDSTFKNTLVAIYSQVKSLEQASQKKMEELQRRTGEYMMKTKEEERERIVGILDEFISKRIPKRANGFLENDENTAEMSVLQEVKERILSQ